MADLISRQWLMECVNEGWIKFDTEKDENRFIHLVRDIAPSAQPEPCKDAVKREDVQSIAEKSDWFESSDSFNDFMWALYELPSAQPMLYGYDIEHLKLIANVMQKENLPPERVTEALMDIGRIVAIVRDEFEETLRKAVEQCTMT